MQNPSQRSPKNKEQDLHQQTYQKAASLQNDQKNNQNIQSHDGTELSQPEIEKTKTKTKKKPISS